MSTVKIVLESVKTVKRTGSNHYTIYQGNVHNRVVKLRIVLCAFFFTILRFFKILLYTCDHRLILALICQQPCYWEKILKYVSHHFLSWIVTIKAKFLDKRLLLFQPDPKKNLNLILYLNC